MSALYSGPCWGVRFVTSSVCMPLLAWLYLGVPCPAQGRGVRESSQHLAATPCRLLPGCTGVLFADNPMEDLDAGRVRSFCFSLRFRKESEYRRGYVQVGTQASGAKPHAVREGCGLRGFPR